ncbi:hypothetical protein ACA910_013716 [Epithemia clementina (nom. ined.)]
MPSLTPLTHTNETSSDAVKQGLLAGVMVLVPTTSAVYLAMRTSPLFLMRTNWQSRTAMAIMPALFTFGFVAETHMHHTMQAMAHEEEEQLRSFAMMSSNNNSKNNTTKSTTTSYKENTAAQQQHDLMALYQRTLEREKYHIVTGVDELGPHHRLANYVSAHPIKSLGAVAVPAVGLILYGQAGQQHLPGSIKILHTRIIGQFTTVALLLSIMGFKDYMNRNGNFITEGDALRREEEMQRIRQQVLQRLEQQRADQQQQPPPKIESTTNSTTTEHHAKPKHHQHQHQRRHPNPPDSTNDETKHVVATTTTHDAKNDTAKAPLV